MSRITRHAAVQVFAFFVLARIAVAQSSTPAVFVSNNGNLEGSVTAFKLAADGSLEFINRVVTGTRPAISNPCAGCNAYEISLTPNGRFLAVAHAAGDIDSVTIHEVAADASITQRLQVNMPTPLDCAWVNDELLAVMQTDASPDQIVIYQYNAAANTLTFRSARNVGTGSSYLVAHPNGQFVSVADSSSRQVFTFSVDSAGMTAQVDTESSGAPFPLELCITPDGARLYSAGGISDGGNKVNGYTVGAGGIVTGMPGSPFISPGASPSNVFASRDGRTLYVGHGTDATVRVLAIDALTGALTNTGFSFDVGLQGTLGDVSSAVGGAAGGRGLMFVTDNSTATDGLTGIYSFSVAADGSLTQNGPINITGGIAPRSIAVWNPPAPPACPGDVDGDHTVGLSDIAGIITCWAMPPTGPCASADLDMSGDIGLSDLAVVITNWAAVCF